MDYGHKEADRMLKELERRIQKEYRQAKKELGKKAAKYLAIFRENDQAMQERVLSGEISKKDYKAWRQKIMMQTDQWRDMGKELANDLVGYEKLAMSMVGEHMPEVYALNHNYGTYEVESLSRLDTMYTLYDKDTVALLMRDNPNLLPLPKVKTSKAKAWNRKNLNSALLQGILQGESIDGIADRISGVSEMSRNAAVRTARTMTTAAENAGREESYKRAAEMGIKMRPTWIAVLDGRTRHSHRIMDGVQKEVGGRYPNGLRYPGDPEGPAEEVYNCRCGEIGTLDGVDYGLTDLSQRNNKLGDMSYEEWLREKRNESEPEVQRSNAVNGRDLSMTWNRREGEFHFEIDDIINAQGFDGLPTVVSAKEFDDLVRTANDGKGFVAQRVYVAPDQETLDAYRDQLYHGKWYVDCSTGGAAHGQGMYTSANYSGVITEGIKRDMMGYGAWEDYHYVETITLSKDAKITTPSEIKRMREDISYGYSQKMLRNAHPEYSEKERLIYEYSVGIISRDDEQRLDEYIRENREEMLVFRNKHERLWSAESVRAREKERHIENMDDGVFATMMGYDAISVDGHGKSGNYTVILNRTKCIFRGE